MTQVYIIFSLFFLFFIQFYLLQCDADELPQLKISEKCELEGICERVENYPTDLVREIINKLLKNNTVFNYDEPPVPSTNETVSTLSLCETRKENVAPQSAKNTKGVWKLILNDVVEPVQVFRTTICRKSPLRCSENITFREGYDGQCVQKWVYRLMYYLNDTKQADVDFFGVPACCSCTLIKKDDAEKNL